MPIQYPSERYSTLVFQEVLLLLLLLKKKKKKRKKTKRTLKTMLGLSPAELRLAADCALLGPPSAPAGHPADTNTAESITATGQIKAATDLRRKVDHQASLSWNMPH